MDNIAGTPVEGENFFGRQELVELLQEFLKNDDVLLLGPRRIGKTSLGRAVITKVRAAGERAIEINVASCSDEREFLAKLDAGLTPELASITTKAIGAMRDAMGAITARIKSVRAGSLGVELGDANAEDWTSVAGDLLRLIAQAEERWLIYVDELPIFLYNMLRHDPQTGVQRVRRFLDWFRNDVRALPDARKVRWLVSGSVGLDTLVQQHGMADTINSMKHQGLAPFSDEVAVAMLGSLAARYQIPLAADDLEKIVAGVQWPQPYYLQSAFTHLRALMVNNPGKLPADLIDEAIDILAEPGADNDFHHWEKRLFDQLPGNDADHARAMLHRAAQDRLGARPEILLAELENRMGDVTADEAKHTFIRLRDILQRDAYWRPDESSGVKHYRFCLEPLRRWWLRRNTL